MPAFTYEAVDADGTTVTGSIRADSPSTVRARLGDKQLHAVRIEEKRGLLQYEITKERVDTKALIQFTRQLAVFAQAGVAITEALVFIADETTDSALRRALVAMADDLRSGGTLSDAVARHGQVFPAFYVGILRSTELTGRLDEALDNLAGYLQREADTRARLVSALTYPAIVLVLAAGTVAVLAGYVLPQFEPLFDELGTELPLPTRLLLAVSALFTDWWFIPAGAVATVVIAIVWLTRTASGRRVRDRLVLRLPVVRSVVEYSLLERFCRMLSTMVAAGVPIIEGFRSTADGTDNIVFRRRFDTAHAAMVAGNGFSGPLAATGLFPGVARQMMKVGEETGTLDRQLAVAAEFFGREREERLRRLTALFEPALIVLVGAVVGFVAVALVSAMYGVLGDVGQA